MGLVPASQRTEGPQLEGPGVARSPPPVSPRPLAAIGCHVNGGWRGPVEAAAGAVLSSQGRRPLPLRLLPSPLGGHTQPGRKGLPAAAGLWVN